MDAPSRSLSRSRFRRRAVFVLLGIAALAAVAAAGLWLPAASLRWGVVEGLRRLGMAEVALDGADLSLFQGRVRVQGVTARGGAGLPFDLGSLVVGFRWRPLLDQVVSLREAELAGVRMEIRRDGGGWVVGGLPLPAAGGGEDGWTVEADGLRLVDSHVTIVDGGTTLEVEVDELSIGAWRGSAPDEPVPWRLAGRINGAPVTAEGAAAPFAASPRLTVTASVEGFDLAAIAKPVRRQGVDGLAGRLSARLDLVAGDGPMRATGTARVRGAAAAAGAVTVGAAMLDWSGDLAWRDGGLDADGTLRAERLSAARRDGTVEFQAAAWTGTARAAAGARPFSIDGEVTLAGLVGRLGEHRVDHGRAGATGRLTVVADAPAASVLPPVEAALDLWVEGVRVGDPALGRLIGAADRVVASGVTAAPADGARVARIEASGLEAKDGRVRVARAVAEQGALSAAGDVTAKGLALDGVSARLVRTADGFEGFPAAEGEGGGEPMRLGLARLTVTGGRVEFEDRTPSEPVRLTVDDIELAARRLDTGRPDRDSPFRLSARLQGARIEARGALRPFASTLSGSVKGRVEALDLPALSPYAADTFGVRLHTGQFDGDLAVSLDRGALDGRMDIVLSRLFVDQPDPRAPLARQADMPVETVLDLLRDSEQRIRLTIPVRGDLSRPDFDVSDAVSQAVGGALKSTVLTTLKVAFPVVALIGLVIDEASTPRLSLEPLVFAAGEQALTPAHEEHLGTVAELLHQRPGVKLTICGVAVPAADWPPLAERRRRERADLLSRLREMVGRPPVPAEDTPDRDLLGELADRRNQAVKGWLVAAGVEPGRLFVCRPRLSEEPGAVPAVDLLI